MFSFKRNEVLKGNDKKGVQIYAEDMGGDLLGSAHAHLTGTGGVKLESIHTKPQSRGQGIGGALLDEVRSWGRSNGASHLSGEFVPGPFAEESDIREFYRKRGVSINDNGELSGEL